MNEQLYSLLGIDRNEDLKSVLEALEEKQFEYLERSETVSDESRKEEIASILKQIDEEIVNVKEQIKSISSSLILDEPQQESPEKAEESKKASAENKEKVAEKVDSLKQKETEKQAKEAERKKKEAEKAAQKQQAAQPVPANSGTTGNSAAAPAPVKQVSNTGSDLVNGINSYNNRDYTTAFKVFKELSEKGDASAQYLLAGMYINGLGIPQDYDRALFWLKKSAEAGEPAGQAAYGAALVLRSDAKEISIGFKYLQNVSDKGDTEAMLDYVNACLKGQGSKKEISRAMDYCEKLKAASDDSFNKKKYDDAKTQLKTMKKNAGKTISPAGTSNGSSGMYIGSYTKKRRKIPWKWIVIIIIGISIFRSCSNIYTTDTFFEDAGVSGVQQGAIEQQQGYGKVRITVAAGNVRSGAGTDYGVIGGVHQGEEYLTTGNSETTASGRIWYEIFLDEEQTSTGWVSEAIAELAE